MKALFDQAGPRQLILVEHNAHAVAQWVALACAALPPALARTLTFTTYTRRPDRARQHLVGTLPDPNLDLAAAATDPRYCVHDCTGGTSTRDHPDAWGGLAPHGSGSQDGPGSSPRRRSFRGRAEPSIRTGSPLPPPRKAFRSTRRAARRPPDGPRGTAPNPTPPSRTPC
ncbi:hypothetical protein ACRAWF_17480 [Streptomyces sp. L7]